MALGAEAFGVLGGEVALCDESGRGDHDGLRGERSLQSGEADGQGWNGSGGAASPRVHLLPSAELLGPAPCLRGAKR